MLRSLYSGITGLRNHQLAMDVTSHNIANVNTTGYKSSRVTFKEGMSQILKGATRPPGNSGGTNPMQVGLGMAVGSVDTNTSQGAMQSTGLITDLAIEGRAYFAFSNGTGTYYGRNGALQLDANGNLVSPNNGYNLLGLTAEPDGTFSPRAVPGSIHIPYGEKAPAKATEEIEFSCNLDSDSQGLGTVLHTARFLTNGSNADSLTEVFDQVGNDLGIKKGDVLKVTYTDNAGVEQSQEFTVGDDDSQGEIDTLSELATSIQSTVGGTVSVNPDGSFTVNPGSNITNLGVTNISNPISNPYVSSVFNWSGSLTSGTDYSSKGFTRVPPKPGTLLENCYDANGNSLGLEDGDYVKVSGSIGGDVLPDDGGLAYDSTATTLQDLMDHIQSTLNLPNKDGSVNNRDTLQINSGTDADDRAPIGSIMIRGRQQTAFALSGINISAENSNKNKTAPTAFNSNMIPTEIQTARDTTVHSTSIEVYDESGAPHTVTTTFTHSGEPGKWLWEITLNGEEKVTQGNTGTVTFGQDGSPASWVFTDGKSQFGFNPMNGSNEVKINLNTGGPGLFTGITQFRSTTTTAAKGQDGYPMGKLSQISITENGEVNGVYTNGTNRTLAKILLADFSNPAGLLRVGDSMYSESNNSGEATLYEAGSGTTSKIKPGALEMSNVDLATEFTNLITIQRGYQANSRVITTSDSLLQELVQLVR